MVSAEPLSLSCFPELLLTNYLRSGCDSRAEVFALNICQPGCRGSAISPSFSSVTFTIKPAGNTSLLGSARGNWGWNPPLMSLCAPPIQLLSHSLEPAQGAWLEGPSSLPTAHGSSQTQTLGLGLSALKALVESALPSPFPYPLAVGKDQLEE